MIRSRLKRIIAVAMSAAVALTAAPNLPVGFTVKAEAASTKTDSIKFGSWWENASLGSEITETERTISFKSKTDSTAKDNFHTPDIILYYGDENCVGGTGYSEVGVIRSDLYAWFGANNINDNMAAINAAGITFTKGSEPASWADWFSENKKGVDAKITTKITSGTATIIFENNGVKSTTTVKVADGKKLYVSITGEQCEVSGLPDDMVSDYYSTVNSYRCASFLNPVSYGREVTDVENTINFKSKTFLSAASNWLTPSVVVYYGDENKFTGEGYEEVAVIRSDLWAYFEGDNTDTKTRANLNADWNTKNYQFNMSENPDTFDWATWFAKNKKGVDCSIISKVENGVATITFSNAGLSSTTSFKVDSTKKLYVSVTGDNCRVSGLPDDMMKLQSKPDTDMDADAVEIDSSEISTKYAELFGEQNKKKHVTVHDPSVVIGYTDSKYTGDGSQTVYGEQNEAGTREEVYFIFGSHRAFAWSTDMQNWTYFKNNINDDTKCQSLFASAFAWSEKGDSEYDWSGNLWAPDIIWNKQMKKWCMYMSINGKTWNSSIVLLTSDSLNGDWENKGTVVYSGFTKSGIHSYTATDFASVVGSENVATAIKNFTSSDTIWNLKYGAHAIDPCVTYNKDGGLWMSYGSWSGGIWMFKLDEATGLRDKTISYKYTDNKSDPYMGYKLAGGNGVSGEASYIEKIGDKYYLFLSYGGLTATGGYNMRVFSSENINGPYKDVAGNDARKGAFDTETTSKNAGGDGNGNGTVGERLMSYYKWSYLDKGRVAQGHNSAIVDNDGKTYLVYHTRFNDGTESHEVRVHQLFTAKNGGLVTTPFEYSGETLSKTAYDKADVAGDYNVILQKQSVTTSKLECCTEQKLTLNTDGKVSGDYEGTWSQDDDAPYVTITVGKVNYQGVFIKQKIEGTNCETMCFTVVGENNVTFWGTKGYTDEAKVVKDASEVSVTVPKNLYSDIELPTTTNNGSTIIWKSSDESALSTDGKRGDVLLDTKVTLTMTVKSGKYYTRKTYSTTVKSDAGADYKTGLVGDYTFENGLRNEADTSQVGEAKALANGVKPAVISTSGRSGKVLNQNFGYADMQTTSYTQFVNPLKGKSLDGATVALWVNRNDTDVWDALWSFFDEDDSDGKSGRTYFTPNAYLGYNGTVAANKWFDCNHPDTVTNLIKEKEWHHVAVSLGTDDFGIYIDGKLVSDKTNNITYAGTAYEDVAKDMLSVIASSANFYLGYGSWWGSAPALMDNLKIYERELSAVDVGGLYNAEKAETGLLDDAERQKEQAVKDASILYRTYNYDDDVAYTNWSSHNAASSLTLEADSSATHKNYVQFAPGNTNSRDAYTTFGDITLPDKYVVEFDSKLTAGNDQESQLALTTAGYAKTNRTIASASYLWSLNTTNSEEWTISGDGISTSSDSKVTLTKGTWAHFKTTVDKTANTIKLEITDGTGKTLAESEFTPSTNIADVKGLFYLSGRYNGVAGFDNIRIYESTNEYTVKFSPNFSGSSADFNSQKFTVGTSQKLMANKFSRLGYKFAGWSRISTGSVEFADEQEITSDLAEANGVVVLYAVWKQNTSSGGSSSGGSSSGGSSSGTVPTTKPTTKPAVKPTVKPILRPSTAPTAEPTKAPTTEPTKVPSAEPTKAPTAEPTKAPTAEPTTVPTAEPTTKPSTEPTKKPTSTKKPSTKKKKMSVKKVTAKKNAKKITGTLSVIGAKVTVKVGNAKAKKAIVKGKTFTFKLSKKLKKNTKIVITITKSKYYTVKKTIKAK